MTTDGANPKLTFELTPKQFEAFKILEKPNIEELLYGGAKGGGKTVFGVLWSYYKAKKIIKDFNLKPRENPLPVGFMGRLASVDFTKTTLETWKEFIEPAAYEIKEHKKEIIIENTVKIDYGGLDSSKTIKKFNSAKYAYYFLDQAEECGEEAVGYLRGTFRFNYGGKYPDYKGLLSCNPAVCWLKGAFITAPQPGTTFLKALPSDNSKLPPNYVYTLKKAFSFKPELLKAYLEGSWDDLDTAFVVIKRAHADYCVDRYIYEDSLRKMTISDIGGDGNDETVIYDFENTVVVNQESYTHRNKMDTCGRIQAHAKKNGSNLICVDVVGEGSAVYQRLCEIYSEDPDMTIYGFDGREAASDKKTFFNKKAEAWWTASKDWIAEAKCCLPKDERMLSQLCGVTYHFKSDMKIAIDPDEILRKNLRCSPDRAYTYVMGLDALKYAKPIYKKDMYSGSKSEYDYNPNTV
jgi:phage terminase large subunit